MHDLMYSMIGIVIMIIVINMININCMHY